MKKIKEWMQGHPCLRRALRTFVQTAVGVLAASVAQAAGMLETVDLEAVIVLAVATGLAAVMNLGEKPGEEDEDYDGSEPEGV